MGIVPEELPSLSIIIIIITMMMNICYYYYYLGPNVFKGFGIPYLG